jgi:hypothetical protein
MVFPSHKLDLSYRDARNIDINRWLAALGLRSKSKPTAAWKIASLPRISGGSIRRAALSQVAEEVICFLRTPGNLLYLATGARGSDWMSTRHQYVGWAHDERLPDNPKSSIMISRPVSPRKALLGCVRAKLYATMQ